MAKRLQGKVAVVTAAGQGIGRAIAEAFVAEGATMIAEHLPRQFPAGPEGLCGWGSDCRVKEFEAKESNGRH